MVRPHRDLPDPRRRGGPRRAAGAPSLAGRRAVPGLQRRPRHRPDRDSSAAIPPAQTTKNCAASSRSSATSRCSPTAWSGIARPSKRSCPTPWTRRSSRASTIWRSCSRPAVPRSSRSRSNRYCRTTRLSASTSSSPRSSPPVGGIGGKVGIGTRAKRLGDDVDADQVAPTTANHSKSGSRPGERSRKPAKTARLASTALPAPA